MQNIDENRSSSRRDFLKIPAALTLAPDINVPLLARSAAANDRITLGVIGTGERGQYLMKHARRIPGLEMVAVCDVYEPRREQARALAVTGATEHLDYREVLDRQDIQAVLIATPDHWHAPLITEAVHAGKDVYTEKPVLHSIDEGPALLEAVAASGRVVATGTQQRSWPLFESGKRIVDSGKLGRIRFIYVYWFQNAIVHLGEPSNVDSSKLDWKRFLGRAPQQPFAAEKYSTWRHYWDFGGGIMTDLLTHWIDVVQWYMGQPAPRSVSVTARLYDMRWQAPDHVTATFEFPGDFLVTFIGGYGSGVNDGGLEFRGSQGTLHIDRTHLALYPEGASNVPHSMMPEPVAIEYSTHDGVLENLEDFFGSVRTRRRPKASIEAGVQAATSTWLANHAIRNGGRAAWDAVQRRVS